VKWSGPPLPDGRLVVVSPHPDDEVLAAGGLMRWSAHEGRPVVIVAVTDGEASHARSTRVSAAELRERRAGERDAALARLGIVDVTVHRLGEPDQGCSSRVTAIAAALREIVAAGDVVVGPSRRDRHPDHVAVARAVRGATIRSGASSWEAPTWALVHRTADQASTTLELDDDAWAAKCHAITAYRSQLHALGPDPEDGPVVHPGELAVMLTRIEQFAAA
jgi:LmbE family N-acetylglucosaminyl deacetylase